MLVRSSLFDSQSIFIFDASSFAEKQSVDNNQILKEQSVVNSQGSGKGQSIGYDSETEQSLKGELFEDDLSVAKLSDVEDSSQPLKKKKVCFNLILEE